MDPTQQGLAGLANTGQGANTHQTTVGGLYSAPGTAANDPGGSYAGGGTGLFGWGTPASPKGNVFGNNQDANAVNQGAVGMGVAMYGRQGPQISTAAGDAYGAGLAGNQKDQAGAIALQQQTAMGKGAAIDASNQAIQGQFNQQLGQQLNSQMAMANSARGGGPGLAAAQSGAAQQMGAQTAQSAQASGIAAAQARAQMMNAAQQQYGQQALAMGQQNLQAQQQQYQLAGAQANLQSGQNSLNQQGLLAEQGIGQAAELAQLQANENAYANQLGLAGTNNSVASQGTGQAIGAGIGAATGLAAALA